MFAFTFDSIARAMKKDPESKAQDEAARLFLDQLIDAKMRAEHVSQNYIATQVGAPVSSGMISSHRSGTRSINVKAAVKYAQYFKCPIEPLLGSELAAVREAITMLLKTPAQQPSVAEPTPKPYATAMLARLCKNLARLSEEGQNEIDRQIDRELTLDQVRDAAKRRQRKDNAA